MAEQSGHDMILLKRQSILNSARENLMCTLGSVGLIGMTLPVLISLYREDVQVDLCVVASSLGYPSIKAMLDSSEFKDIIKIECRGNALGAGSSNSPDICYSINPPLRLRHIIQQITDAAISKDSKMQRAQQILSADPEVTAKMIQGKERIIKLIAKLGGETQAVSLLDLQKQYVLDYNVQLDKKEMKAYFTKSHIKKVFDLFMYREVEIFTDTNFPGSLFMKLKMPLSDILKELLNPECVEKNKIYAKPSSTHLKSSRSDAEVCKSNIDQTLKSSLRLIKSDNEIIENTNITSTRSQSIVHNDEKTKSIANFAKNKSSKFTSVDQERQNLLFGKENDLFSNRQIADESIVKFDLPRSDDNLIEKRNVCDFLSEINVNKHKPSTIVKSKFNLNNPIVQRAYRLKSFKNLSLDNIALKVAQLQLNVDSINRANITETSKQDIEDVLIDTNIDKCEVIDEQNIEKFKTENRSHQENNIHERLIQGAFKMDCTSSIPSRSASRISLANGNQNIKTLLNAENRANIDFTQMRSGNFTDDEQTLDFDNKLEINTEKLRLDFFHRNNVASCFSGNTDNNDDHEELVSIESIMVGPKQTNELNNIQPSSLVYESLPESKTFSNTTGNRMLSLKQDNLPSLPNCDSNAASLSKQPTCHAEKFLKLAAKKQEEKEAIKLAYSLAKGQRFTTKPKLKNFTNVKNDTNLTTPITEFCKTSEFVESPPTFSESESGVNQEEEQLLTRVKTLSDQISSIVKTHQPYIKFNELEKILVSLNGKPNEVMDEKAKLSLSNVISKYCINVVRLNNLLIWNE